MRHRRGTSERRATRWIGCRRWRGLPWVMKVAAGAGGNFRGGGKKVVWLWLWGGAGGLFRGGDWPGGGGGAPRGGGGGRSPAGGRASPGRVYAAPLASASYRW